MVDTAFQEDAFQFDAFQIASTTEAGALATALRTRTFTCNPSPPVVRETVTYTSAVGFDTGQEHLFNRVQRPLYKFELHLGPLVRAEAESLSAFHSFHRGSKSFIWNGGTWGAIENYSLMGEGDGSRRDFYLPNRYIGINSISIRTANQATGVTSDWAASSSNSWPYSLNANPGLILFANSTNTIPASGHDFMAAYSCYYRCVFEQGGLKMGNVSRGLFVVDLKLMEVPQVG